MFKWSESELREQVAIITTNEIKQQPELWEETLQIYTKLKDKLNQFIVDFTEESKNKVRVVFTGAGTSEYVGNTLVPYLQGHGDTDKFNFVSLATTDIVAAPLACLNPDEPTILVSFARSGNSPESLGAVDIANKVVKNIRHIAITCAEEGSLANIARKSANSFLYLMPAKSNDQGFAMTGSFSCMTLGALLLFDAASTTIEKIQYVKSIVEMGHEVIAHESDLQTIIDLPFKRIVYLGSGSLAGLTQEAQLKVLELTAGKIATVFDSSMGFRHGPKSFVDGDTLIFVFVSNDDYTRQYDIDILNELKNDNVARAIFPIVGKNADNNYVGNTFTFADESIVIPDGYLALPYVMAAQTLALLASIKVGNTPDTPSPSGTVNRVVKGVTIHSY